jgi:hypothetical protein
VAYLDEDQGKPCLAPRALGSTCHSYLHVRHESTEGSGYENTSQKDENESHEKDASQEVESESHEEATTLEGDAATTGAADHAALLQSKSTLDIFGNDVRNSANIQTVEISTSTHTKLANRRTCNNDRYLTNSVSDDHPLAEHLVMTGRWPNEELAYPTTDNCFSTPAGKAWATFNDAGSVFDLESNFLGNPFLNETSVS